MSDAAATVRACYQAYVDSDRNTIEALISDAFRFTSPLDNGLDRATYFERCWPNHEHCEAFDFIHVSRQANACLSSTKSRARAATGSETARC